MRVTTPSPSVPCRTESPVESDGHVVARRDLALRAARRSSTTTSAAAARARLPLRQLVEEARRQVVRPAAVEHPRRRVQQRQPLHRARHADVCEAALLLDAVLLDRARVREDPLLHPDHVDGAELEALRVVQRHQRHERALAADRVLVGVERDLLQERRQRRLGRVLAATRARAPTSSCRFSIRPCASIVRSASSDSR